MYCAGAVHATDRLFSKAMPNRELFLTAATTNQLVGRIVEAQLRTAGIPGYLLAVLTHVRDLAPVSPTAVAEASGVPPTTLRDNIQRLVDRGLVKRVPNPTDGRSYLLVPTPKGRAVARAAGDALESAYLELEKRLPRTLGHYDRVLAEVNRALRETLEAVASEQRPYIAEARSGPGSPPSARVRSRSV